MSSSDTGDLFADIVEDLARAETFSDTADVVVSRAREALGASHAGVTLHSRRGGFRSIGVSGDEVVAAADALQHSLGEGPCVDTASDRLLSVWSADLTTDDRWPRWGPEAVRLGLRSVLSSQLASGTRRVGALNVYSDQVRRFDAGDAALAHLFAVHAAAALVSADRVENLERAMERRTVVGHAQGILMERFGIDAESAFAVLTRYSQHSNVKLHSVAETIISTRELPESTDRAGESPIDDGSERRSEQ